MKCISCGADKKYKERASGRCSCGEYFAFEPKRGDKITDAGFKRCIDLVSAGGKVRFTKSNLYYEVARYFVRKGNTPIRRLFVWLRVLSPKPELLSREQFVGIFEKWCNAHKKPKGLVEAREYSKGAVSSDIEHYSFDRAVICDRQETVDLLIANNFHIENNCAVLGIDGYPPGPFDMVRKMLRNNPKLHVFALHDATPVGCTIAHTLADSDEWFKGKARVVDVGLRPVHAKSFDGYQQLPAPMTKKSGVSTEELDWLTKHSLELAVIRPEQILKRLFKGMKKKYDDGGDTYVSSSSSGDGGFDVLPGGGAASEGGDAMSGGGGMSGGAGATGSWSDDVTSDNDSFSSDASDADGGGDDSG